MLQFVDCGQNRFGAVSYTHLDVYKRQHVPSAIHHVDGQAALGGLLVFGLHVPSGVQHGADDLVQRDKMSARAAQGHAGGVDGPVSYTHLDVYKRQAMESGI